MKYSYLALGDSYTIGEQVLPEENFPNQTVSLLNKTADGIDNHRQDVKDNPSADKIPGTRFSFTPPEIIAATGWTTDELDAAIDAAGISKQYDIVSLLIGVNNQYRGRTVHNFETEFEHLLQRAIQFAGNHSGHVIVLSIPDWGLTPFAEGRDRNKIAAEIDSYNLVCKTAAEKLKSHFIDITTAQRRDGDREAFLATDKLHPSGKEYTKWAAALAIKIKSILKLS